MNNAYLLTFILVAFISKSFAQTNQETFNDKLIIVLHVQSHYTNYEIPGDSTEDFINNVNKVIESANPDNVIYVNMVHRAIEIGKKGIHIVSIPFPGGSEIDSRVKIVNENILDYIKFNVFKSEDVLKFIKKKETKEIVLIGLMADECVAKNALEGMKLDYKMYIVPDAILGYDKKSKAKAIEKMSKKGVEIIKIN